MIESTDKVFIIPLTSIEISLLILGLTAYILLFSSIIIYRFVSDDEFGRRNILFLNNVTTGTYITSLYLFYAIMMLIVGAICGFVIYFCNIVSRTVTVYLFLCFLVAGLANGMFSIFIGILIHQKYISYHSIIFRIFGIIVCIGLNILGYFLVSEESLLTRTLFANLLPGY